MLDLIIDNVYVEKDIKVIDHFHITGKYRGSAHRGVRKYRGSARITVRLNNKSSIVFKKVHNYESHLIMQELGKFDF